MSERIFLLVLSAVIIGIIMLHRPSLKRRTQLPYRETLEFEGARLSYKILGKRKPIILLHGAMINNPWGGFEERLAESYQVFLPDLPGFGASDAIEGKLHNSTLFAHALCAFLEKEGLKNAPIIGFSLGTVVATKSAAKGCAMGKLILIGMPGKISGWKFELANKIPISFRRLLATTEFGKEKLLIPILRKNTGGTSEGRNEQLLKGLTSTDPRAVVDIDVKQEIEKDLPANLSQLRNEKIFIYGERDKLKNTTTHLIKGFITIPNAKHNIFRSRPEATLEILRRLI